MTYGRTTGVTIQASQSDSISSCLRAECARDPRKPGAEQGFVTLDMGADLSIIAVLSLVQCLPFVEVTSHFCHLSPCFVVAWSPKLCSNGQA